MATISRVELRVGHRHIAGAALLRYLLAGGNNGARNARMRCQISSAAFDHYRFHTSRRRGYPQRRYPAR